MSRATACRAFAQLGRIG